MAFEPGKSGNPAGRPKGSRDRRLVLLDEIVASAAARLAVEPDTAGFDAHTFLVAVYRSGLLPVELRVDAAKAALRFEKPALMSQNVTGHVGVTVSIAEQLARTRVRYQHPPATIEGRPVVEIASAEAA